MKVNGSFALCAAVVVAISAAAANARSYGSDVDDAFFAGLRSTPSAVALQTSPIAASYGECASCAGEAAPATVGTVVGAPVWVGAPYDVVYGDFVAYDPWGYDYGYAWTPVRDVIRGVANVVDRIRPVRRVVAGVRNLFVDDYSFCRPGYLCDPCWMSVGVCDPCFADSCWSCADFCDPCAGFVAPRSVYAPASCCGYGVYPGEVNELDPETGLTKTPREEATPADSKGNRPRKLADRTLSTDELEADDNAPAIPQYDSSKEATGTGAGSLLDGLDAAPAAPQAPNLEAEPATDPGFAPAPQADPNLTSAVIRMLVPEDAVVYVNGYRTKQKGELRAFAARELEPGLTYSFEIRVVAERDGRLFEETKTTELQAGERTSLAFNLKLRDGETYAMSR